MRGRSAGDACTDGGRGAEPRAASFGVLRREGVDVGFGVGGCGFICGEGAGVVEVVASRSGCGLNDGVRERSGVGRDAPAVLLSRVAALGGSACGFAASGRMKSSISWSSSFSACTLRDGEAMVSLLRGMRIREAGVAGDMAEVPEIIC